MAYILTVWLWAMAFILADISPAFGVVGMIVAFLGSAWAFEKDEKESKKGGTRKTIRK